MSTTAIDTLQRQFRGTVIGREHPLFDEARCLYNGMIDKRPLVILRCANVADVIAGVRLAREEGLLLAIRGGGHNGPGLGSCDDGVVIDLSMMKGVRVDAERRTVRVDAGCTSGDVDHATHAFGLAIPFGIVSTTGVAGLTLGGPLLPKGLQWYWKADFVRSLPDEAIDVHIAHAAVAPTELSLMHLYPIDGAVRRVAPDATAWNARDATWSMVIAGIDADPARADALKRWGRAYWQAVHPFNLGGAYVNFMMDEDPGRIEASYGDNYGRLAQVKAEYDAANLFRVNQNIQPPVTAAGGGRR